MRCSSAASKSLPTLGDGRQSGTSDSPSILNASPESAAGGGLAWLRDRRHDPHRPQRRRAAMRWSTRLRSPGARPSRRRPIPPSNTPWEELFREKTGQLAEGGVLEFAVKYRGTSNKTPRHNH